MPEGSVDEVTGEDGKKYPREIQRKPADAPVAVESTEQSGAVEGTATETDPWIEEFVTDIRRRGALGQRRGPIIHRVRKQLGAELADAVKAALDAGAEK